MVVRQFDLRTFLPDPYHHDQLLGCRTGPPGETQRQLF